MIVTLGITPLKSSSASLHAMWMDNGCSPEYLDLVNVTYRPGLCSKDE